VCYGCKAGNRERVAEGWMKGPGDEKWDLFKMIE
jgi:hypothetical protein